MKKLIVFILAAVLCLGLCSCGKDNKSGIEQYVGNTYVGTTPWGDDLSITVNSYEEPSVTVTIVEKITPDFTATGEYGGELEDGNAIIVNQQGESVEDGHGVEYKYTEKLEFKDGTIAVTYVEGQATTKSPDGDSGFHHAGALTDENNTVVLEKK